MKSSPFFIMALFVIVVLFSGCDALKQATPKQGYRSLTLTEDEKRDVKCKVVFTDGLNEQKIPVDNISEYQLDSDTPLYFYVRLFNLYREEYFACVNLYTEDGKLFDQFDCIVKPEGMKHDFFFMGKYFSSMVKPGKVLVEIRLNNEKVDEANIMFINKLNSTAKNY